MYKAVPWAYQPKGKGKIIEIAANHRMTRSGRCYAPEELSRGISNREHNHMRKIIDAELEEFRRMMLVKKYSVEEQLRKTPAHI